ncbi:MAG: fatty acid desaturase [Hyphomicrobiales bacterium]|nr:MAG: fatty acid desaturase [Hyphomicrobiales bacterium]
MNIETIPTAVDQTLTGRAWMKVLAPYQVASNLRGAIEIAITLVPFMSLWALTAVLVTHGYTFGYLLTIPTGLFLLRLFMVQHDCGHSSFFSSSLANNWTGRIIGVLTLTPFDFWKHNHALHHAGSGNLDHRGVGDVSTLTLREYREKSKGGRFAYRLYRNPFVMFGIGPAYLFLLKHRLPIGRMRRGLKPWVSTMGTNLAAVVIAAPLIWLVGWQAFFLIQLPVTLVAASVGVWLFYVQHQYEDTSWEHTNSWNRQEAALHGSSHYDLPGVLRWFTANIGIHHIHHLCSRIPYYSLTKILRDFPELRDISRLTLVESLRCPKLTLWDEAQGRLISFREARALAA